MLRKQTQHLGSQSVLINYTYGGEEGRKKAVITNLVNYILPLLQLQSWNVQLMDDDLEPNRKHVFVVDNRGLTFHSSVGQAKVTEDKDGDWKEKHATIIYVWNDHDILNWMKFAGQIQKYTNSGFKAKNKNVIILLLACVPQTKLGVNLSNTLPKVRFVRYNACDESFNERLHEMVFTPIKSKMRKPWRYENAITDQFTERESTSLRRSKRNGRCETEFGTAMRDLRNGVVLTKKGVEHNSDMLHQLLAQFDKLDKPTVKGTATSPKGKTLDNKLRQLFKKIHSRIRVNTRNLLRFLIADDQTIEEIEQRYGTGSGEEVNKEVIYKCLCYWAVTSDREPDELEAELDEVLELTGNPSAKSEMSMRCKFILNVHRQYLTEEISDPEAVCITLQDRGCIVEEHKRRVIRKPLRRSKVDFLIDIILTLDDHAYYELLNTLAMDIGQKHIAEELTSAEMALGSTECVEEGLRMDYIKERYVTEDDGSNTSAKVRRLQTGDDDGPLENSIAVLSYSTFFNRARSQVRGSFREIKRKITGS